MYAALRGMRKERTVIIIAHRLSAVRTVDEILVLDNGHLVERGTHEALLACNGTYTHLFAQQRDLWENVETEGVAV
ncbi:hypothetical protein [Roseiflexus castenholzii]|uniref:hypothetical protein n=1 Tax=Roseiflexus castenholzii TaxID=120962 RepID=UPI0000E77E4D|nr:hypothetical protein [Roseiflexus castenholzii]